MARCQRHACVIVLRAVDWLLQDLMSWTSTSLSAPLMICLTSSHVNAYGGAGDHPGPSTAHLHCSGGRVHLAPGVGFGAVLAIGGGVISAFSWQREA